MQELIDDNYLYFKEDDPNIKNNPLPDHNGSFINAGEKCKSHYEIKELERVKNPMSLFYAKLI